MELLIVSFFLLGLPMVGWMLWAAWTERGTGTHCEEIRTSISGRCVALSPAEKKR